MPASTSPRVTFDSTALTSTSWLTGVTLSLALVKTLAAVTPQGTDDWHRATFTPGRAKSDSCMTLPGLVTGTAISITFRAKGVAEEAAPASVTCAMFFGLAEANTSAGAPWVICAARPELGPKLNTTLVPGCVDSNCRPRPVNDSLSDAAAKSVMVPETAADAESDDDAAAPLPDDPQPANEATATTSARTLSRLICCSMG